MKPFLQAHATHPDWRLALAMVQPQLEAQQRERGSTPTLGWVYLTDHHAAHAEALLAELQKRWPGVAWVGGVGIGVCASGVEYFDEPALTLMLAELPPGSWRVFSGAKPLGDFAAHTAQVHADPATPDVADLVAAMSERTASGYALAISPATSTEAKAPTIFISEINSQTFNDFSRIIVPPKIHSQELHYASQMPFSG